MARANPFLWIASGSATVITYRKVTASDRRWPRGRTFHETWEEAHAALITRLESEVGVCSVRLASAKSWLASTERALAKAQAMTKPEAES